MYRSYFSDFTRAALKFFFDLDGYTCSQLAQMTGLVRCITAIAIMALVAYLLDGVETVKQDATQLHSVLKKSLAHIERAEWYSATRDLLQAVKEDVTQDARTLKLIFGKFRIEK